MAARLFRRRKLPDTETRPDLSARITSFQLPLLWGISMGGLH